MHTKLSDYCYGYQSDNYDTATSKYTLSSYKYFNERFINLHLSRYKETTDIESVRKSIISVNPFQILKLVDIFKFEKFKNKNLSNDIGSMPEKITLKYPLGFKPRFNNYLISYDTLFIQQQKDQIDRIMNNKGYYKDLYTNKYYKNFNYFWHSFLS